MTAIFESYGGVGLEASTRCSRGFACSRLGPAAALTKPDYPRIRFEALKSAGSLRGRRSERRARAGQDRLQPRMQIRIGG